MFDKKLICLFLILVFSIGHAAAGKELYHFSYSIKGEAQGRFLVFFPYHVYLEASASALFEADWSGKGVCRFTLYGIDRPGFLMRSLGFSGVRMVMMAAASDMNTALRFIEERLRLFRADSPGYAKILKSIQKLLLKIPDQPGDAINFERVNGRHLNCRVSLPLEPQYNVDRVGVNFNVYKIMGHVLLAFHVPIDLHGGHTQEWESTGWDFSNSLNAIIRAVADFLQNHIRFRQRNPITLTFRPVDRVDGCVVFHGEANPDVPILRHLMIRKVGRTLRLSARGGKLLSDSLLLDIRDKKGRRAVAQATLRFIGKSPDE